MAESTLVGKMLDNERAQVSELQREVAKEHFTVTSAVQGSRATLVFLTEVWLYISAWASKSP